MRCESAIALDKNSVFLKKMAIILSHIAHRTWWAFELFLKTWFGIYLKIRMCHPIDYY